VPGAPKPDCWTNEKPEGTTKFAGMPDGKTVAPGVVVVVVVVGSVGIVVVVFTLGAGPVLPVDPVPVLPVDPVPVLPVDPVPVDPFGSPAALGCPGMGTQ
jgi:hypothetical protein